MKRGMSVRGGDADVRGGMRVGRALTLRSARRLVEVEEGVVGKGFGGGGGGADGGQGRWL